MATEKTAGAVRPKKEGARPGAAAQTPGLGPFGKMRKYLGEVQAELRRTTWPTRAELIAQTQVVIGVLILVGVLMYAWDLLLGLVFKAILRLIGAQTG